MLSLGNGTVRTRAGVSRRDFLRVGGLGLAGLSLQSARAVQAAAERRERAVIFLMLVGGPSQLETWDPKPKAASDVRGPFRSIATSVPSIRIGEHFPRMAQMAERYAIVRSLFHDAAPIHETGFQLMRTGWLFQDGLEYPSFGSVVAHAKNSAGNAPPAVVLPGPLGNTGVSIPRGEGAGFLGAAYEPQYSSMDVVCEESEAERYGPTTFGQSCLLARMLVERGVRMVTVNMFETVFGAPSWDCHGSKPFSSFDDYRRNLCPQFDLAYTTLLSDLESRGLLDTTLVVASGEFGRTPRINASGGRDHWPGVWSMLLAGGGVRGGQVIGSSDKKGGEPVERPVRPAEVAATIYHHLGIDPAGSLLGPEGQAVPLVDRAEPIRELWG